ncbi:MAG: acetate/propionate family kinase [Mycoplasmatales bacterium]
MRKTLIINAGSSSLKFKLYEMPGFIEVTEGIVDRIGLETGEIVTKLNGEKFVVETKIADHEQAISLMLEEFKKHNVIADLSEITKVGHRVVQGGEIFKSSVLVGEKELEQIIDLAKLAPLHNIPNAQGIKVFMKLLPTAQNIAVFDTEFHATMPEESFIYPVPMKWYRDLGVRRYGAHGTSHKFIASVMSERLNKAEADIKFICCHLGNGASVTAIDGGKSIMTSMGLTPLAGLMMGTRSGDIDPSIINYVAEQTGMSIQDITNTLNKESGMLGLSEVSSDFRDIEDAIAAGNKQADLALDIYCQRLAETIGSYFVLLGGLDAIVFTAGIGENGAIVRERVLKKIACLGVELDEVANDSRGDKEISTANSKVKAFVIPTEEEYQIALEAEQF